jgi:hypothetical protein
LLYQLKDTTAPAIAALDERVETDETIEMLTGNLEKITEHGNAPTISSKLCWSIRVAALANAEAWISTA